jgi:hypothetical protein
MRFEYVPAYMALVINAQDETALCLVIEIIGAFAVLDQKDRPCVKGE